MGYWSGELFQNDSTLDYVDGQADKLKKSLESMEISYDNLTPAHIHNAAIFLRGIVSAANASGSFIPGSCKELAQAFENKAKLYVICENDKEFRQAVQRELLFVRENILVELDA